MTTRRNLGDEVANHLREEIFSGYLAPGDRLIIRDLADRLGVSTMPVREALVSLASEGLVAGRANRGFQVVGIPEQDIMDLFTVHAFVSGLVAERAAEQADEALIERLRAIEDAIEALDDEPGDTGERAAEIEELNHQFHRVINLSVRADRLHWLTRVTGRHVPRSFYGQVPGWAEQTLADHPALIEAIRDGDGTRARRLMEAHVLAAGELVAAARRSTGEVGHA